MPLSAQTVTINFDKEKTGQPPQGFSTALTGEGKPGVWTVLTDATAPSPANVLAQTDMDDTGYRFPLCVFDNVNAKDVDISVKFKAVKGSGDQAAGLVWRYRDKNNYYVVRANALEDNVRMYRMVKGARLQFAGANVKVAPQQWHTMRVVATGNKFDAYFDGKKIITVTEATFNAAGKVGLWTKADSYTLFDDFVITTLPSH
ncbi:MAG: hypothetical protein HY276_00630 [Ignavibacteriales bacterium]|nr:hypothetical protein [Ignavibacteriales bacterium]